jgi:signal transduction histidine kinase
MRGLVGILRDTGGAAAVEPSLARAEELVAASGLPARLTIDGERTEVPRLLDASAYRVLQGALTNVLRHNGPVGTCVTISYAPERITVAVVNEPGEPALRAESGGHGLVGMRERVALFRGTLRAGSEPDGGFAVRASFPIGVAL